MSFKDRLLEQRIVVYHKDGKFRVARFGKGKSVVYGSHDSFKEADTHAQAVSAKEGISYKASSHVQREDRNSHPDLFRTSVAQREIERIKAVLKD